MLKVRLRLNSGFTIVELIIVIVIVGILAAITIVGYVGISNKANESAIIAELTGASKKLSMYFVEYSTYPTNLNLSNGCPIEPIADVNYCIEYDSDAKLIYNYKTSSTYELNYIKNNLVYEVSDSKPPEVSPNWLIIGNQTWAKFNLNVGTRIATTSTQNNNMLIEKYCANNLDVNCTNYGGLYQWNEAMQYSTNEGIQGICPQGSHIPSDDEWKSLEMKLSGMSQATANIIGWRDIDEGTKLKIGGSSGLNIPPAGLRSTDGYSYYLASESYLWTSSQDGGSAWFRYLRTTEPFVLRNTYDKLFGFSVRCLGD